MKYLSLLIAITTIFISCEKEGDSKNLCPVVSEKALPAAVFTAFQQKYPTVLAEKWFNKDNKGYCGKSGECDHLYPV